MTNCPNCGAPLKNGTCEYCGTQEEKSKAGARMVITSDRIEITCGEVMIDEKDRTKTEYNL